MNGLKNSQKKLKNECKDRSFDLRMPNESLLCKNPYDELVRSTEWNELEERGNAINDLKRLELTSEDVLLDLGCGAGFHTIAAADMCKCVHAIDLSVEMLRILKENLRRKKIVNAITHRSGLLQVNYSMLAPTKVFSWGTLHHLPDTWKGELFERLAEAIPDGGLFLIMDLIYSFGPFERSRYHKKYLCEIYELHGKEVADDLEHAFRYEFVTYDWILLGLLERAGFCIVENSHLPSRCWGSVLCKKI